MLRAKIFKLISSILNNSEYFNYNDFQIAVGETSYRKTPVTITYEYDPQYFLELDIPSEKSDLSRQVESSMSYGLTTTTKSEKYQEYEIKGRMCPGSLGYEEPFNFEGANKISEILKTWLINL